MNQYRSASSLVYSVIPRGRVIRVSEICDAIAAAFPDHRTPADPTVRAYVGSLVASGKVTRVAHGFVTRTPLSAQQPTTTGPDPLSPDLANLLS